MSETYELAVIGAGPAGMEAALTAAEAGVHTVLIDHRPEAGGQYYRSLPEAFTASRKTGTEREGEFLAGLLNEVQVAKLYNALVWGIFKPEFRASQGRDDIIGGAGEEQGEGWLVALYGPDAPKWVHARALVLASGAYDTPVAFPGWTLPGVMTCGAALILLKTQRVAPARRALVTGTGPLLLSAAAHLIQAGVEVAGVCESNRILPRGLRYGPTMIGQWHRLAEGAGYLRIMSRAKTPYKMGWSIVEARGRDQVEEAVIARVDANGAIMPGSEQTLAVDAVISGYSLTPNTGLARMIGCQMEYRPEKGGWVPVRDDTLQTSLQGVYVAGDGGGIGGAENSRLEGRIAGAAAAVQMGHLSTKKASELLEQIKPNLTQQRRYSHLLGDLFTPNPGLIALARDDTILCRCEEISLGEVRAAVDQGARTIGEVKMLTRTGMGNCQGRMCERSVAGAISQVLKNESVTPESVGMYSIRPPLHPLSVEFLAEAYKELIKENDDGNTQAKQDI
jgi:NADPH-dependent 2,4-dienoyl-CoA reductase/sulfur reductase-like enzyme